MTERPLNRIRLVLERLGSRLTAEVEIDMFPLVVLCFYAYVTGQFIFNSNINVWTRLSGVAHLFALLVLVHQWYYELESMDPEQAEFNEK